MDEERFQRAIDIIVEQQAIFYSGLQELQEVQKGAEKRTNVLERACLNLYNSSVVQGKNIAQLTEEIRKFRDGQKETDDRLNAAILMAEKYFSDQNGKIVENEC